MALLLVVLAAFAVEAASGFGGTVITVTFGAFLLPVDEVLAVYVPVNLLLSAWIVGKHQAHVDTRFLLRRVAPLMGAGFLCGLALFQLRGETWIKAVFGAVVAGLSLLELTKERLGPPSPAARAVALVGSGVVHGLFACGGPLLVWVAGRELDDKGRFRATLSATWLTFGLVLTTSYAAAGTLSVETLQQSATLLPMLVAGLWIGERAHGHLDPVRFRKVVFSLLLFAGLSLVARTCAA
jgi:uncharacterized membrane protein YfcA